MKYARRYEGKLQPLTQHLTNVAASCKRMGTDIGHAQIAEYLGAMHDLGKSSDIWQAYLMKDNPKYKEQHSTTAWTVAPADPVFGYCFCGHHGGLDNWDNVLGRRRTQVAPYDPALVLPPPMVPHIHSFAAFLRIKMLHSILVDADIQDAQSFEGRVQTAVPKLNALQLLKLLNAKIAGFPQISELSKLRTQVYHTCSTTGKEPDTMRTLTVPTGGGKTLSSMAYALQHAALYNKQRIIYVIPFTSIIEQVADEYRKIFGSKTVLEHHSNFIRKDDLSLSPGQDINWESPIIVTTAVQFLDSLYGVHNSSSRKIHNIANSVIVFDEAQKLPRASRDTIMKTLQELAASYNCTVVFCTATQPHLSVPAKEIIPDRLKRKLYKDLKRVTIYKKVTTYPDAKSLAVKVRRIKSSALIIVNTRQAAKDIAQCLPVENTVHLSAYMYPAHRREVLAQLKLRLASGEKVYCITTQLIEAGVDIDFPVVWRQMDALDSIVQAAGRCNREGKLITRGVVRIFSFPGNSYTFTGDGQIQKVEICRNTLKYLSGDPVQLKAMTFYMKELAQRLPTKKGYDLIYGRTKFDFPKIAEELKTIDSIQKSIFVVDTPRASAVYKILQEHLQTDNIIPAWVRRRMAQYTISVFQKDIDILTERATITEIEPGLYKADSTAYDRRYGLISSPVQADTLNI